MPLFYSPSYVERLLAFFSLEVLASMTAALILGSIGRWGLVPVLLSPVTLLVGIYNCVRSFRMPAFVFVVGTTETRFAEQTADVVLRKVAEQRNEDPAPVDPQQQQPVVGAAGNIPNAAIPPQRPPARRNNGEI